MGPVSVKLIIRAILFASLFLIWLFTFNGRISHVSGELFRCKVVWNHYNRYNPCTESKCIKDCGRRYSAATNKCLSASELEEDGYEEIIDYGDKEEADRTGGAAAGNINYDDYKHMACCCNAQAAVSVGDGIDEAAAAAAAPLQQDDHDELGGPVQLQVETAPTDQGPKKFSCSKAFVPEEPCVDIRCIKDCGELQFKRARCLVIEEVSSQIQHLTSTDQTVINDPVGSSSTNSNDEELACGCYPQQKGDFYICTRAFWDYTEENPCTQMKCFEACIGAGESFGRCLKRSVIVVNPKYGFPNQDELVEEDDDHKVQKFDDSSLRDKLQKLDDDELQEELDDSNPENDNEVQRQLDDHSNANDEKVQNPDDSNNNDEKVQNLDDSNPNTTKKACCCNPSYYV